MENRIVDRLIAFRKTNKLSVIDIERITKIPKDRIYSWERGKGNPKSEDERTILQLMESYGVSTGVSEGENPPTKTGEILNPAWTPKSFKALRLDRKMTQEEFGSELRVSRDMVSKWENGTAPIDDNAEIRIQSFLDREQGAGTIGYQGKYISLLEETNKSYRQELVQLKQDFSDFATFVKSSLMKHDSRLLHIADRTKNILQILEGQASSIVKSETDENRELHHKRSPDPQISRGKDHN